MRENQSAESIKALKQFEAAVWVACNDLFITTQEAVDAIEKYKIEQKEGIDETSRD